MIVDFSFVLYYTYDILLVMLKLNRIENPWLTQSIVWLKEKAIHSYLMSLKISLSWSRTTKKKEPKKCKDYTYICWIYEIKRNQILTELQSEDECSVWILQVDIEINFSFQVFDNIIYEKYFVHYYTIQWFYNIR